MWLVVNKTPFAADYTWVVDKDGNKIWLVLVKAAFVIQPNGSCRLAESPPIRKVAQPYGEFGESSLRYESDILGVKPTTDILLQGAALAPPGRKVTTLDVSLQVGMVHKHLRVTGDRVWTKGGLHGALMSAPVPFEEIPLTYERAYGGWDRSAGDPAEHRLEARNPVGTGFSIHEENCGELRLPNIEYPDQLIGRWNDRPSPAGFNVVDCAWSPRRELAGTYDDNWLQTRFPSWAEDFDPHYNNCAPTDQQSESYLVGGEPVEVVNMSENGVLSFEIPKVRLAFRTRFGRTLVDHTGQLCTVVIEPNVPRVLLVWQTALVCNRRADQLDETLVVEKFSENGS